MTIPRVRVNRHTVIVAVCLALVFTAGVLSNKAWQSHEVQVRYQAAKQAIIVADAKRRQANEVAAERARLKAECDKEVAYYNSLTATQKSKTTAPACQNLQPVQ